MDFVDHARRQNVRRCPVGSKLLSLSVGDRMLLQGAQIRLRCPKTSIADGETTENGRGHVYDHCLSNLVDDKGWKRNSRHTL